MLRLALLLAIVATSAPARDLRLGLPVDCALGDTCFIQHYVDRDPGPGNVDFTCGPLTYDAHKGTDFALPTMAAMEAGVDVVAAAPGLVARTRDGMADTGLPAGGAEELDGRDCGNAVVIDHGDGWETQYCHLRKWSVTVDPGRRVRMGEVVGQVGLSGATQFPHLDFSVRHDGEEVDPFDTANLQNCGATAEPLWLDPPAYRAGGFMAAGITSAVPEYAALKAGAPLPGISRTDPLVVWGLIFGGRAGDSVSARITGPGGIEVFTGEVTLERTQAQLFRAMGRRAPAEGWPAGLYSATIRIIRGDATVDARDIAFSLDP